MKSFVLARARNLNGQPNGERYILYSLGEHSINISEFIVFESIPYLVQRYLEYSADKGPSVLSTSPKEKFITIGSPRGTSTLGLEELTEEDLDLFKKTICRLEK